MRSALLHNFVGGAATNRIKTQVELQDKEGLVFKTFDSKNQSAEFLGISTHTVSKRKITNSPVIYKNQEYFIK